MIKIEKNKFDEFLEILKKEYNVFAPKKEGAQTSFKEIKFAKDIEFNNINTKIPKEIFFPQAEELFMYKDSKIENIEKKKAIAVWGVRPCSAKSFILIDKIFGRAKQKPGDKNFEDPLWKTKYDDSLVFTIGCNTPASTCFCNWVDCGPFDSTGSDVMVYDDGNGFLLEGISKKGIKFLSDIKDFEESNDKDRQNIEVLKNIAETMLSKPIDKDLLKVKIDKSWNHSIWDEMSAKCINCGACTYNCPTCHCFDIQDEGKSNKGKRIRLWDSCMFPDFTNEASGHNPRDLSKDRFRQRFMHKFKYFPENNGDYLCTGCGKCIQVCPVNVDVRDVLNKIIEF